MASEGKSPDYYPLRWKVADAVEDLFVLHRGKAAAGVLLLLAGLIFGFIVFTGGGDDGDAELATIDGTTSVAPTTSEASTTVAPTTTESSTTATPQRTRLDLIGGGHNLSRLRINDVAGKNQSSHRKKSMYMSKKINILCLKNQ